MTSDGSNTISPNEIVPVSNIIILITEMRLRTWMTDQDVIDMILEVGAKAAARLPQPPNTKPEQIEPSDSKTEELQQDSSQMGGP